ncbi:amino acid ABC transporter substrate-binding protein [Marinomonas algicola]|jgi:general L-amino acid transport system substrate-binding protein|uniref:amino acid ABC transporter substrate-binding protein n=1 Tax=Marinomonas algicola TaxID=2773454 RepID=UPI00174A13C2|nr:amino acid ABC transporter substrate-binding protein [Marinomonas algicola]
MKKLIATAVIGAGFMAASAPVFAADKLQEVKDRGVLKCGIHPGKAGFSTPDTKGNWTGLDIALCKAVAAAVFGDQSKVEFITMNSRNRLTALVTDEIDMLARSTTFTATRDGLNGVDVTTTWFYDGQGLMVNKSLGVNSIEELDGATICTYPGTTSEKNINDYFESRGLTYNALIVEASAESTAAYLANRCDAVTNDASALAADRQGMPNPMDHVILPERISKEPLGAYVKQGNDEWRQVVTWTAMALIEAEEMGITQGNVDSKLKSDKPDVMRILGVEGNLGQNFGLDNKWAYNAIKAVGNYGEIFDRNLGKGSALNFERGLNALYTDGGLLYAYPFR